MPSLTLRVEGLEERVSRCEAADQAIVADIAALREELGQTATKADLERAHGNITAKIEHSINGILRDALAAVPGKQMALWSAIAGIVGVAGVVIGLLNR